MNSYIELLKEEDSLGACISQSGPPPRKHDGNKGPSSKVIHDRIHDQMVMHAACVAIIDTPQFQRLRDLHQLGNCRYLFPGAVHTRFEHSLGVAHLAQRLMRLLKQQHEAVPGKVALNITPADELCITIAGLCHDLGHGPYSHMFEGFVNNARREKAEAAGLSTYEEWCHEDASIQMFDFLLNSNDIDLSQFEPSLGPQDITFIKQLINGLRPGKPWPAGNGRDSSKRYMFDIVCNKRNGIDVDKLDYFLRDSMSCYGKLPDVHIDRVLTCARVIEFDGETQIAFEEKVALSLVELFTLRAKLHKFVYQHRVVKVVDEMTKEAFACAERGGFEIEAPPSTTTVEGLMLSPDSKSAALEQRRTFTLSASVVDMSVYQLTGDWMLNAILASNTPELSDAREIIHRIRRRELYSLVGYCNMQRFHDARQKGWKERLAEQIYALYEQDFDPEEGGNKMPRSNIFPVDAHIVFGSSGDAPGDPINNVRFYNPKRDPDIGFRLSDNRMSPLFSPREFEEWTLFVYSRSNEFEEDLQIAFHKWKRTAIISGAATEPVAFVNSSPVGGQRKARRRESMDASQLSAQGATPPPAFRM